MAHATQPRTHRYARSSARPPHAWAWCVRAVLEAAAGARARAVGRMAGRCRHAASSARQLDRRRARASVRRRCGACLVPCRWCGRRSSSHRQLAVHRGPTRRAYGVEGARQSSCGSHAPPSGAVGRRCRSQRSRAPFSFMGGAPSRPSTLPAPVRWPCALAPRCCHYSMEGERSPAQA